MRTNLERARRGRACRAPLLGLALAARRRRAWCWRGRPTLLITSAEHYGAVLTLDVDYRRYLDTLAADGLNYTRIFTGAYVEPEGAFTITRNTLAPAPLRFIAPWARSREPGYANGGHRFDLSRWDHTYFARLTDFVAYANRFDNVFFEIANEPYFGGMTMGWQHRIADVIVETEQTLPLRRLIAQNIANHSALGGAAPGRVDLHLPLRDAAGRGRAELPPRHRDATTCMS